MQPSIFWELKNIVFIRLQYLNISYPGGRKWQMVSSYQYILLVHGLYKCHYRCVSAMEILLISKCSSPWETSTSLSSTSRLGSNWPPVFNAKMRSSKSVLSKSSGSNVSLGRPAMLPDSSRFTNILRLPLGVAPKSVSSHSL